MSPRNAGQARQASPSSKAALIMGSRHGAKKEAKPVLPAASRGIVRPLPSALAGAALEQLLSVLARPDQRRCRKQQRSVKFSPPDYSAAQLQSVVALASRIATLAAEDERAAEAVAARAAALPERPLQRLLAALEGVGLPLLTDFVRLSTYCDRIDCSGGSSVARPEPGSAAETVNAAAALATGPVLHRAQEAEVPQVHRTQLMWTKRSKQAAREERALGAVLSGLSERQVQQRVLAAAGAVHPIRRRLSLPQVAILHALQGKEWQRQVHLARLSQQHVDHGSEQQREMPHTEQELYAAILADMKLPSMPAISGRQDRQEGQQQQEEREERRQQDSATDNAAAASAMDETTAASASSKAPGILKHTIFDTLMLN